MTPDEMLAVYRRHRAAEDARDFPEVMQTMTPHCFLEQVSLGRREGKADATRTYEEWFGAFPDLGPIPEGIAFSDNVGSRGVWTVARVDASAMARARANRTSVHSAARQHRPVQGRASCSESGSCMTPRRSPNKSDWTCTKHVVRPTAVDPERQPPVRAARVADIDLCVHCHILAPPR